MIRRTWVLGLVLALSAIPGHAQQVDAGSPDFGNAILGPAPWQSPDAPESPPGPASLSKAVASVPAIDTSNRDAVVAAYNAYFDIARPAVGFTGSTATCTPGAISLAFQEWTLTRINFMRAMAGVPGNTTLDSSRNPQEQGAALIMAANSTLSHFPPNTYQCWTQAGYDGASSSNLALGTGMVDAIPLYMTDPGAGNQIAGHRRWILHSRKNSFGLGQANGPTYNANALYTFQFGSVVSVPNGIPWPPRGYVPLALFPAPFGSEGQRWSFGLPGANFGSANVTMTLNGSPLAATVVSRTDNGYGDNTLVWELPVGHTVTKNTTYNVTISGVGSAGATSYGYQVLPIDPAEAPPPSGSNPVRLGNISTRGKVLDGDNVMIGGFIIGGSAPKTVLIRARGPSMIPAGVLGAMADPQVTLVNSAQAVIAANDNWGAALNAGAIAATGLAPTNALEASILATLDPGAYTSVVSGVAGGTGVGIVEVFEVDRPDVPLYNISTRGRVLTGDDVMIGGFIIQGDAPQTVLIRARGPSMIPAGVTDALPNPQVTLVNSSQAVLASNDDWGSSVNAGAISLTGLAPTNALESAILITLNPGPYTAVVSGVGGATGVGIVEVFAL